MPVILPNVPLQALCSATHSVNRILPIISSTPSFTPRSDMCFEMLSIVFVRAMEVLLWLDSNFHVLCPCLHRIYIPLSKCFPFFKRCKDSAFGVHWFCFFMYIRPGMVPVIDGSAMQSIAFAQSSFLSSLVLKCYEGAIMIFCVHVHNAIPYGIYAQDAPITRNRN